MGRTSLGQRSTVMLAGHAAMLTYFRWILNRYEPDPTGLRLNDLGAVIGWGLIAAPPVLLALLSRSWLGLVLCAMLHALSPLMLVGTASNANADLNFAAFTWWFYVPAAVVIVVAIDRRHHPA